MHNFLSFTSQAVLKNKADITIDQFSERQNHSTSARDDQDDIEMMEIGINKTNNDDFSQKRLDLSTLAESQARAMNGSFDHQVIKINDDSNKGFQKIEFDRTISLIADYSDGPTRNSLKCVDKYLKGLIRYSFVNDMDRYPFIIKELEMRELVLREIYKKYSISIFCPLSSYQKKKRTRFTAIWFGLVLFS